MITDKQFKKDMKKIKSFNSTVNTLIERLPDDVVAHVFFKRRFEESVIPEMRKFWGYNA